MAQAGWEFELYDALNEEEPSRVAIQEMLSRVEVKSDLSRMEWPLEGCPLQIAAYFGEEDLVKQMLQAGFAINSVGQDEKKGDEVQWTFTALHYAVEGSQAEMIGLLLDHGADPNVQGTYHKYVGTPLDWARQINDENIVYLLENYSNGNYRIPADYPACRKK